DITYVDENDKVIFYNRGEDRVFARSKGIIGREVRFCHPPKSVDMVLRILKEFKAGTKDVAEFWFDFRGQMIHIRYFAIRDKDKTYRGVIEMSQDVTDIRGLKGQKRLLDWD
ncbi:PAS domain-containing protein, partial [Winogradskyella sp.]|uniref:PAS domain-containing protein n=1 Tax=Winogradskyella sp. TaxID=1883156 RepID=UPI0025DC0A2A